MSNELTPQRAQDVNVRDEQAQLEAEQRLQQIRQEMGADNQVLYPDLFRPAPSSMPSPFGPSRLEPPAPNGAPSREQVLRGMTADAFYAALPTVQKNLGVSLEKRQLEAIVTSLTPRPDGFPLTLDDELDHHPLDARDELAKLHKIGWRALQDAGLPLYAVIELEHHGGHYSRKAFAALVRLGAHIRDRQQARR